MQRSKQSTKAPRKTRSPAPVTPAAEAPIRYANLKPGDPHLRELAKWADTYLPWNLARMKDLSESLDGLWLAFMNRVNSYQERHLKASGIVSFTSDAGQRECVNPEDVAAAMWAARDLMQEGSELVSEAWDIARQMRLIAEPYEVVRKSMIDNAHDAALKENAERAK